MAKPKRAHLERDLIAALQQRDQAIARAERAEAAAVELEAIIAEMRPTRPSLVDQAQARVRGLLDDLTNALGVGW